MLFLDEQIDIAMRYKVHGYYIKKYHKIFGFFFCIQIMIYCL